jgi:hypothetical protein
MGRTQTSGIKKPNRRTGSGTVQCNTTPPTIARFQVTWRRKSGRYSNRLLASKSYTCCLRFFCHQRVDTPSTASSSVLGSGTVKVQASPYCSFITVGPAWASYPV